MTRRKTPWTGSRPAATIGIILAAIFGFVFIYYRGDHNWEYWLLGIITTSTLTSSVWLWRETKNSHASGYLMASLISAMILMIYELSLLDDFGGYAIVIIYPVLVLLPTAFLGFVFALRSFLFAKLR